MFEIQLKNNFTLKMKSKKKLEPSFVRLGRLGDPIDVQVRQSSKAKRIIIKIQSQNVELVLPNKNISAGYKFLLEKEYWIRRKLQVLEKEDYVNTKNIPLFGKEYLLLNVDSIRNKVHIKENVIHVDSLPTYHNKTLVKFLQNKLLVEITDIVNRLSKQYQLKFSRIKITNAKTRWGSCSSNLILRFNWRLVFAPQEVLNYVIIHEMCHLVEMNHSKPFWDLVAKLCPEYKTAKLWLKENGSNLHRYLQIEYGLR